MKKAQIAVAAVAGWLCGQGEEVECDTTAFADYQVPRVLRALGVLQYSPELSSMIENHDFLPSGCSDEVAIRAATVLAVERMSKHFNASSAAIDSALWNSQEVAGSAKHHLTLTQDY